MHNTGAVVAVAEVMAAAVAVVTSVAAVVVAVLAAVFLAVVAVPAFRVAAVLQFHLHAQVVLVKGLALVVHALQHKDIPVLTGAGLV